MERLRRWIEKGNRKFEARNPLRRFDDTQHRPFDKLRTGKLPSINSGQAGQAAQASRDEIFIGGKCFSLSYFAVKMVGRAKIIRRRNSVQ